MLAAGAASLSLPSWAAGGMTGGKPITLMVSYPAGGGADLRARLIAPRLSGALGPEMARRLRSRQPPLYS